MGNTPAFKDDDTQKSPLIYLCCIDTLSELLLFLQNICNVWKSHCQNHLSAPFAPPVFFLLQTHLFPPFCLHEAMCEIAGN